MSTSFQSAVRRYIQSKHLSKGTKDEYKASIRKWICWGQETPVEEFSRSRIREFLDWVYDKANEQGGQNPERTANKARDHLRAVVAWAWENDIIDSLPRFPKPRPQRDVSGRHYLTKAELNAIYFATYRMPRPRGWTHEYPVGCYWRSAIVLFFNYGLDYADFPVMRSTSIAMSRALYWRASVTPSKRQRAPHYPASFLRGI